MFDSLLSAFSSLRSFCVEFWKLSHLTHGLSQAEKKINVAISWANTQNDIYFTQNDQSCHFVSCSPCTLSCRIVSKKDFQTSFFGQEYLIAWHLYFLMDAFWIIKSSFSLFRTLMARTLSNIFADSMDKKCMKKRLNIKMWTKKD